MKAAVLREVGGIPEYGDFDDPPSDGEAVVLDVAAAGLNPIDLRIASGGLPALRPQVPCVVCREGVGVTPDGRRVYFDVVSPPWGTAAERCPADPSSFVEVPEGLEPAHAVCFGIAGLAAWLALERRAQVREGDTALILGATGIVGEIGVQVARLLGARRVVAVGRKVAGLHRALGLGADAAVLLGAGDGDDDRVFRSEGDDVDSMAAAFRAAAGDAGGYDVVLDPLWGDPAAAAVEAMNPRGRLVQLGQSAGATAPLRSVSIRFRELNILGHTNFAAPLEVRRAALARMFGHAAAGELVADYEQVPLAEVASAWKRQAESPGVKLVLTP